MGKRKDKNKHYSGKELIVRRQMERQRQQSQENGVRRRVRNINQIKKTVEAARQDMRKRAREGKDNGVSD